MESQTPTQPAPVQAKGYISLPPEPEYDAEPIFSVKFVIFAVVVIGLGILAGCLKSGRIPMDRYFAAANRIVGPAAPAAPGPVVHSVPAAPAAAAAPAVSAAPAVHAQAALTAPVPPLKPDAFVVTSISIGQPSIAIINGISHVVGDAVSAPGVTGWRIRQITDDAVLLQNGSALSSLPLSAPGMKPLDDTLHPLN